MRFVLALGLLMTLCVFANAATTHHRSKRPEGHFRPIQRVTIPTTGYAVPGWTDEQTGYWLDNATVAAGLG
jgi:hypothetical protein